MKYGINQSACVFLILITLLSMSTVSLATPLGSSDYREFYVLLYDANGRLIKSNSLSSRPSDVSMYKNGEFVVVGKGYLTYYNNEGKWLWYQLIDYHGSSVEIDSNGDVVVSGSVSDDGPLVVEKYNRTGERLWAASQDYFSSGNPRIQHKTDPFGDVIVHAISYHPWVQLLHKYDSHGEYLWTSDCDSDCGKEFLLDSMGRIYVTSSEGELTTSLNRDGDVRWHRSEPSVSYSSVQAVGRDDQVLLSARANNSTRIYGYSADGERLIQPYAYYSIDMYSFTFDPQENIIASGSHLGLQLSLPEIHKYISSVDLQWKNAFEYVFELETRECEGRYEIVHSIDDFRVNSKGTTYLVGSNSCFDDEMGDWADILYGTVALDSDGNELWRSTFDPVTQQESTQVFSDIDNAGFVVQAGGLLIDISDKWTWADLMDDDDDDSPLPESDNDDDDDDQSCCGC